MPEIEKFDSKRHGELVEKACFSYATCPPLMDLYGHILNTPNERFLVWQSVESKHLFSALHTPAKRENWQNAYISRATREDIDAIKAEGIPVLHEEYDSTEYYYETKTFLDTTGRFGKKARRFERQYKPTVTNVCDRKEIEAFYEKWYVERDARCGAEWTADVRQFDREFFFHCLNNLERYPIRQVYIWVEGKLAALAMGSIHSTGKWVGLHVKVDRQYEDISRFLQRERAKLFPDCPELTLGSDAGDKGVAKMKQMLDPIRKVDYFVVRTGKKA